MTISEHAGRAIVGALAGAILGWGGHALTTAGRVDAIERTLQRIEARLDTLAGAPPARTHEQKHDSPTR